MQILHDGCNYQLQQRVYSITRVSQHGSSSHGSSSHGSSLHGSSSHGSSSHGSSLHGSSSHGSSSHGSSSQPDNLCSGMIDRFFNIYFTTKVLDGYFMYICTLLHQRSMKICKGLYSRLNYIVKTMQNISKPCTAYKIYKVMKEAV